MNNIIVEKIDNQVGLADVTYETKLTPRQVAVERMQSWQAMVGHELPDDVRITLNVGAVNSREVYYLVFTYTQEYTEGMGWIDPYQCDTFYVRPGLHEAVLESMTDAPQTVPEIHRKRCELQGQSQSSSGTGATAAALATLYSKGQVAKHWESGVVGEGTLRWHK